MISESESLGVMDLPAVPPGLRTTDVPRRAGLFRRVTTWSVATCRFLWKYLIAILCTQNVLLSVLLVGWTNRFTQRVVFKRWWQYSGLKSRGIGFQEFIESIEQTAGHAQRPNWVIQQNFRKNLSSAVTENDRWWRVAMGAFQAVSHSFWLNLKIGVQVMFNTWVFTLPGSVCMLFAWEYGWNNSFNKGYEYAHIGPATGLFGVALFIAAMMYVPMATARQAATGSWKSFYEFSLIAGLIRRRAFRCLFLAALFALAALPVNLLKTAPGFLTSGDGDFARRAEAMTVDEARAMLTTYYFWAAAALVPSFVLVRLVAGRIYASAMLAEIRYGKRMPRLAAAEREVLARLSLLEPSEGTSRLAWKVVGWTATRTGLVVAGVLSVVLWFTFISQTYVSEFLNYHSEYGLAWLNNPLVQLPFFRFIPAGLKP